MDYLLMNKSDLNKLYKKLKEEYVAIKESKFKLNMSRGKPCREQIELSKNMLNIITIDSEFITKSNEDCLNYGILDGIQEIKDLFSSILEVPSKNIIVGGNSSLNMMFDTISCFMFNGINNETPWKDQEKIKFLCPCPGYDRHFAILDYFKIEPIIVPMNKNGPDMDIVEKLVSSDEKIKGIWCVPKYSNPQGITYSDETVRRFAALKPKATDFRIFWDNAYVVHDISDKGDSLLNIMNESFKHNNENLPILFCSTSKITFPGAGVAALAASELNLKILKKKYSVQTIGYDKLNQLRHVRFLKNLNNILDHMKKHKKILSPKFKIVLNYLNKEFLNSKFVKWTKPNGGYFISVDLMNGTAKRVVTLCKDAGLILTPAGATYPKGMDLYDNNIRIAPTYPSLTELEKAMKVFCLCIKLSMVEKIINEI